MNSADNVSTTTVAPDSDCFLTNEQINSSYNLTLHIISIFVLLVVSLFGALAAVGSVRVKCLRINPIIISTGKFFGSGVVLATGFVHILPDAIQTLNDSCLPESWTVYGAYGGLFAMLAALVMQLIEFLAHQHVYSRESAHTHIITKHNDHKNHKHYDLKQIKGKTEQSEKIEPVIETTGKPANDNQTHDHSDESTHIKHVHSHGDVVHKENQNGTIVIEIKNNEGTSASANRCEVSGHHHGAAFHDDGQGNKISTYLLECGIALHSVLIGLTLGTTTDSFVALFIALCLHQFFEAFALGAQIARTTAITLRSAIFMVIFFSLTTPVGIAIGVGVHSGIYNPKSVTTLLVTGILDSLSAGILIYVSLVNLITADMGVHASEFHSLSKRLKLLYYVALYLGVAVMAVIGRWA
ncbi:unnamed protein product [Rotaria magnacalcarata]|uniref:Uncharacterized protein n=1 Tax=Rotaria magnacalcarata TaxID=392030 RepID=A0A816Z4S4_9BILA|nr:unnamed protein product [Rotaria magnacalcarata]CAF1686371.1 unnamed protein product [Rotaria magnacalcarata]CAF2194573.1 unnamed protein product [Rotaria magnacalcarata]CAF3878528.1 unnamed protein product [Rotaria magnacalcarata]CAF3913267.1 unnamed protein product [Rotaria magnacalcarata]